MIRVVDNHNGRVLAQFRTVDEAVWWVEMSPHAVGAGEIQLYDGETSLGSGYRFF